MVVVVDQGATITSIMEVRAWKTSDGMLFPNEREALRHEKDHLIIVKIEKLFKEHGVYSLESDGRVITEETFLELRELIYEMLKGGFDSEDDG